MTVLTISRYVDGINTNDSQLPINQFVIREGNETLSIKGYLLDHPDTISFSSGVDVDSSDPDDIVFTFSGTLTPTEETTATTVIEEFRDKVSYSTIEQKNIDEQEVIKDALEQVGDSFDEDTIEDLVLPDFMSIREEFRVLYEGNWSSLSVGEKRILIADWLIPTASEIAEIFQDPTKRSEIRKLFGTKVADIRWLQVVSDVDADGLEEEGEKLTESIKDILSPSKSVSNIFSSRNTSASADANAAAVRIPFFDNVRESSSSVEVIDSETAGFTRDGRFSIEFWASIRVDNNNTLARITGYRDRGGTITEIDSNMDTDAKNGVNTNFRIAEFQEGDEIYFELSNQNSGGGAIIARANQCTIKIKEE